METFNTAAAETKAPRPCLQIALTNNPIEIRTLRRSTVGSGKRGLDGPVWADLIIMCMFDHGHCQSQIKWRSKKDSCYGFKIQDCHLLLTLAKNKLQTLPGLAFPTVSTSSSRPLWFLLWLDRLLAVCRCLHWCIFVCSKASPIDHRK